jgi:rhamnose utilization protein RhaD (predicted bifunctional aldolase and dehydrogenase)
MNSITDTLKASVISYCSTIGKDPLLVQGAGGNVSWKEGDTLWIKASGTWLAEAAEKDIFVPVDLPHLRAAIEREDFSVTPRVRGESALRPSIETLLHALIPHRVVVHLHAIEILAHLVRNNCQTDFQSLLDAAVSWVLVAYKKPGAELAEAVCLALNSMKNANVVFLQNHGVVFGGDSIEEIDKLLKSMTEALYTSPRSFGESIPPSDPLSIDGKVLYYPVTDQAVHQLAMDVDLFSHLKFDWALYPDHVVFLGAQPYTYSDMNTLINALRDDKEMPELIFVQNLGVFTVSDFSLAKQVQLRCYYDVMVRQHKENMTKCLTSLQIGELLNWDAEQYRMGVAK